MWTSEYMSEQPAGVIKLTDERTSTELQAYKVKDEEAMFFVW